jgi:hypothetical protein
VGEAGAVREPDGVRARERGHVARGEVVLGEHGDEVLDAHVGSRDAAGLGDEAVYPAELDGQCQCGLDDCNAVATTTESNTGETEVTMARCTHECRKLLCLLN